MAGSPPFGVPRIVISSPECSATAGIVLLVEVSPSGFADGRSSFACHSSTGTEFTRTENRATPVFRSKYWTSRSYVPELPLKWELAKHVCAPEQLIAFPPDAK